MVSSERLVLFGCGMRNKYYYISATVIGKCYEVIKVVFVKEVRAKEIPEFSWGVGSVGSLRSVLFLV